ncbi:MAG: hypothetical protein O7F76_01945 [Planctomycetota bacterium]|nr:hypothetical protein [Planctomycetota bacterium]
MTGFIHINICPFHCLTCVVKTRRHAAPWLGLSGWRIDCIPAPLIAEQFKGDP